MRGLKRTPLPALLALGAVGIVHSDSPATNARQPKIEARKAPTLEQDGLVFRDLNKNGSLDRYEDCRLRVSERIADLVSRMTLEEKVGLLLHPNVAVREDGVIPETEAQMGAQLEAASTSHSGRAARASSESLPPATRRSLATWDARPQRSTGRSAST